MSVEAKQAMVVSASIVSLASGAEITSEVIIASIAGSSLFFIEEREECMVNRIIYFTVSFIVGIIGSQSLSNYFYASDPAIALNQSISAFICSAFCVKVVMHLYSRLDKSR